MLIPQKPINPGLLAAELTTAGVAHNGISVTDRGVETEILTTGAGGALVDLPAGAAPVVNAHAAPPTRSAYRTVTVEDVRTTDGTQSTLATWPLAVQTLYHARFTILAVDTGNGDCRVWTAKATAKRLGGGALLVGAPTLETSHADAGATSWALAADANANTFRVRITGAAGRTISWSLVGEVLRARPDGLVDL